MNKNGVVLHCRNTFLLNRFMVHSSRRTVIRIHEDSAFKRKQQVGGFRQTKTILSDGNRALQKSAETLLRSRNSRREEV